MKYCKILLLFALCSLFLLTMASASISIDETFSDDTPFTNLERNAATSSTLYGLNICGDNDSSAAGDLAYNATSPLTQGSLFTINLAENARCWKLDAGQQLFFGQSGVVGEPSGLGAIACNGDGNTVGQVAVAVEPGTATKANGTNVGKISYFFGDAGASQHHLVYDLVVNDGAVDVIPSQDGVAQAKIGSIAGNTWGLITTVWASKAGDKWATSKGKGWAGNTTLTVAGKTKIYSFLNANPTGSETPWELAVAGGAGGKVRTMRFEAGSADALYLDDIYMEAQIRAGTIKATDKNQLTADDRLNAFNQPYSIPGGVPVELSVFEVR